MNEIVLAADLGGTNLRMSAVNRNGSILYRTKRSTPRVERAEDIVSTIVESAAECIENVKATGSIVAIGVAVPSGINYEKGIVIKAPNVPCLDGFRLAATLSNELNLPIALENDANAYAIGEQTFGAAKGFLSAIAVTLGTGVGGGIIIDNKILRGIDGMAGEIGHICVEPFGNACNCGGRGCIEQYSSATAVVRIARELENQYPKSQLHSRLKITSADVYEAGKNGDELSIEVFRQFGFYLGIALASLINSLNPEVIVIGGGASDGWDLFINHVTDQIKTRAYRVSAERAKIVKAICGDDAGILGVAKLAFEIEKTVSFG
jgi:glucokinase